MTPPLYLGHGAAGTAASMRPHVEGLARRGIEAHALDLPKRGAEKAVPVFLAALPDPTLAAVGGHSYGGRMASMLAAQTPVRGLVLFSYPLHRPGFPDQMRTEHWPRIACPVLLLSGDRDPFARIDLLRATVPTLAQAELVVYPGLGHGLLPVLDDALDRVAGFLRALA